jgi:hypothetical protein
MFKRTVICLSTLRRLATTTGKRHLTNRQEMQPNEIFASVQFGELRGMLNPSAAPRRSILFLSTPINIVQYLSPSTTQYYSVMFQFISLVKTRKHLRCSFGHCLSPVFGTENELLLDQRMI